VRPVTLNIVNAASTLDSHLETVSEAFDSVVEPARRLLGAEGINGVVMNAPDQTLVLDFRRRRWDRL